jgi:predicted NAD/FAD-binding protein
MATQITRRIAIIGGGWAGLAAASRLTDRLQTAGLRRLPEIHVFEAAPAPGGRAKGLHWQHPTDPSLVAPIDNGQHLILGAHRQTLARLSQLGILERQWQSSPLIWRDRQAGRQLQLANGPLWRLVLAQLWLRAKSRVKRQHLSMVWPVDLFKLLSAVRQSKDTDRVLADGPTDQDTLSLAKTLRLSEVFTQRFFVPLVEAMLNTPAHQASASVFLATLSDVLDPEEDTSRCWHPQTNLGQDALDPWQAWLIHRGVQVHCGQRVSCIKPVSSTVETEPQWQLQTRTAAPDPSALHRPFDAVLICCAPWHAKDLLDQSPEAFKAEAPAVARLYRSLQREPLAIATAWLWLPRLATDRALSWAGLNTQALYPLSLPTSGPSVRAIGLFRPAGPWGRLASLSFSALRNPDRAQLEQEAGLLFAGWLGSWAQDCPTRLVIEKQATWSCDTQGKDERSNTDLDLGTGVEGVWLASDAHLPGLPATIESAVRAGEHAADQVIDRLF